MMSHRLDHAEGIAPYWLATVQMPRYASSCMLSLRGLSDFVPEGLNDGSNSTELAEVQAIYCLVSMQKGNRALRAGIVFAFRRNIFLLRRCYQEPSPLSDAFFPFQN